MCLQDDVLWSTLRTSSRNTFTKMMTHCHSGLETESCHASCLEPTRGPPSRQTGGFAIMKTSRKVTSSPSISGAKKGAASPSASIVSRRNALNSTHRLSISTIYLI